jgi:hypothetical protein
VRRFFALFVSSLFLQAQQTLNNDSIIKMVKAGLSDDVIASTVNSSAGTYDTTVDGLIGLKSAGVNDKVIAALVAKNTGGSSAPAAPSAPPATSANPSTPPPPFHSTDGKIRLYVTDHPIFESDTVGKAGGNRHGGSAAVASHTQAGDDPRTVEIQADIQKVCPANVVASNNPDRSDYVLVFRRQGGKRSSMFAFGGLTGLALSAAAKVDGASLFQNDGDMIYATKQNTVEKAIKDLCAHIPGAALPPGSLSVAQPQAAPAQ